MGELGAIKDLTQGAIDMIRDAAQKFADEKSATSGGGDIDDLPQSFDALNKVGPGCTLLPKWWQPG